TSDNQHPSSGRDRHLRREKDGTAADVLLPSTGLARRHTFPPPGACTRNSSDSSGRRMAAGVRAPPCTNAKWLRLVCASLKQLLHFPLDLGKRRRQGFETRIDDDLPARAGLIEANPHHFAHPPLDTVANHGAPQGAGTGKTHLHSFPSIISQTERGK